MCHYSIPETKNVVLEEMDTLFGGKNHVENGGTLLRVKDAHHADLSPSYVPPNTDKPAESKAQEAN